MLIQNFGGQIRCITWNVEIGERRRRRQQETANQREQSCTQRSKRRQHSDQKHEQRQRQILQLHSKRDRLRQGTLTADASQSDEEIKQRLKFTVSLQCNDMQQELNDLYNARKEYLSIRLRFERFYARDRR